jgi:hypothetical protein
MADRISQMIQSISDAVSRLSTRLTRVEDRLPEVRSTYSQKDSPDVDQDELDGFARGSIWGNVKPAVPEYWICRDPVEAAADWSRITPEAWTSVSAFTNSWVNFDAVGFMVAAYRAEYSDVVRVRGHIKNGVIGSPAFALPGGYRPLKPEYFIVWSNGTAQALNIATNGNVIVTTGFNTSVAFDVTFSTT